MMRFDAERAFPHLDTIGSHLKVDVHPGEELLNRFSRDVVLGLSIGLALNLFEGAAETSQQRF